MSEGLDLNQLQAELELKRSALADSILAKLPGFGSAATSPSTSSATEKQSAGASNTRPRQANLGLGASPKGSDTANNGKARSAADLRLKGALTAKRKRIHDDEPIARAASDSDDDVSRAEAITAKKGKQTSLNGTSGGASAPSSANGKAARKDPFATKGIEAQKATQNQPRIVILDGQQIDLSKLTKTQRKKINKQLRTQQQDTADADSNDIQVMAKEASASASLASPPTGTPAGSSASAAPTLTALQAQMLSKLSGSRFRTINEKLYTTASPEAVRMIEAAPAMFDEYHQGFREQVRSWPKNPLDRIVELFDASSATSSVKTKSKGKGQAQPANQNMSKFSKATKARFSPGALVVDLGAGEGGLAKKLVPKGVKVLCYDLVTTKDGWVRKQDTAAIGGLPLPGYFDDENPLGLVEQPEGTAEGVADVAVFCLSLMGTNWIHMILEAKRVLRTG